MPFIFTTLEKARFIPPLSAGPAYRSRKGGTHSILEDLVNLTEAVAKITE
jgi:hypothetical protein